MQRVRQAGIAPRPTWVSFTPWTTWADFVEVLEFVEANRLIDHVDPVQYSIRLLIPPGSWLAEHSETLPFRGPLDEAAFTYRWRHPDPSMDQLQKDVAKLVESDAAAGEDAATTFYRIKALACGPEPAAVGCTLPADRRRAPRLTESWFC
jgi:hypothetical protein